MFSTRYGVHRIMQNHSCTLQYWRNRTKLYKHSPDRFYTGNSSEFCTTTLLHPFHKYKTCANSPNIKSSYCEHFRRTVINASCCRTFSSSLFTPSTEGEHAPFIIKPEISFEKILNNMKEFEDSVRLRNMDVDPQEVVTIWAQIEKLEQQKVQLENERKTTKFSKKDKVSDEVRQKVKTRGKALREELQTLNSTIAELTDKMYPMALKLPNLVHTNVPLNSDPLELDMFTGHGGDMKTIRLVKKDSHEHVHPGYMYLEDDCVLLDQALLSWASHQLHKMGFTRFSSPDMYKPMALEAMGIDVEDSSNQTYSVKSHEDTSHLAGSSPMAFAAYFMMTVFEPTQLPQRCFTVGKHYNAAHENGKFNGFHNYFQTNTVEVCGLCEESTTTSDIIYNQFVDILKNLYSELPLKCRLLEVPVSSLLPSVYRKCALQVWLPNTEQYVEAACVYNCTDYMSRRLKIRHHANHTEKHDKSRRFVHSVHGRLLDTGVLFEAFHQLAQNEDEICIPAAVIPYMAKSSQISGS